ncbi:MAG: glutamate--tRNA ligase [Deltaproteobacteria bacterium]|nr:MAG: glutamate--tRNA ligase [Deltaproteobacteria bacterium]
MKTNRPVKVRIGPSPTGDPHVGTAYIALFNYVFARSQGGSLILRIEDTDQSRSHPAYEAALIEALHWLGLTWDEGPDVGGPSGPYRQSERTSIYREHVEILLERGAAYRCFCTPERLEEVRRRQRAAKETTRYDRFCLTLSPAEIEARLAQKVPFVVRLRMPDAGETVVPDRLRGNVVFQNALIDDQVLLKSDGFPTYHLANVVDDHLMGVTHVIRAEEWINSTPKHLRLYEAFGWTPPTFVHMPLLRNKNGSKISKRKNPTSILYYRRAGYLPQALLNFLGMMGWTMPDGREVFSVDDMIREMSFDRIHLGGPVFDLDKLTWLNGMHIRAMSPQALLEYLETHFLNRRYLAQILPLVHERIETLAEFIPKTDYFFAADLSYDPTTLLPKKRSKGETVKVLKELLERLDRQITWGTEEIETLLRSFCEEIGWKSGELFMMVRIIVTGRKATPPLFETMAVLGREICRWRMRKALETIQRAKP